MVTNSNNLVAQCFNDYHEIACLYVAKRVNDSFTAEDIVQDAYVRMISYKEMLQPVTMKSLFFTTLNNILTDHLRRVYKRREIQGHLMEMQPQYSNNVHAHVSAGDIAAHELRIVSQMPKQRCLIYDMSRFGEATVAEIADELQLSVRTVENHLRMARHYVREELRKII